MGVSAAIFESAGQRTEHYVPGVYSRSNNVSSPAGVSAGNLVILGKSTGGEPGKLLSFSTLSEAKDVLVGGELLKAVGYAFGGSTTYIPQKVYTMRVDKGVQSSITLKNGENDVLQIKSWDWGSHTNQLKLKLQNGTTSNSKKITVAYKDDAIEVDNIIKESFSIVYLGEGSAATASITKEALEVQATGEESAVIDKYTFNFSDYTTIEELVNRVNDTGIYAAVVLTSDSSDLSSNLDSISGVDITEEKTMYSNLAAIVEALLTISYVGSVAVIGSSRVVPDNTVGYEYFINGSSPSVTTTDYVDALTKLELEDIQIIATPSTDSSVHALIASHCETMSNTVNRKERTCILGAAINTSDDDGLAAAKGFNSKYISYVLDSGKANNPLTGETETISGSFIAIMLAGMESAMAVNEPLTFKTLKLLAVSKKRTLSNMENLIKGGIMVVNPNPENLAEIVCIRALTTYQGNNDLISCERSMVREDLYMNRDLRNVYSTTIGHVETGSESEVLTALTRKAKEWAQAGYIIPNGSDNVWNKSVRISGDKVYLSFSRYLTAPRNFVFITATNHVYDSTVEL